MTRRRREFLRGCATAGIVLTGVGTAGCATPLSGGSDRTELPRSGALAEGFERFEETVHEFMLERDVPGGVLGVADRGEVRVERGYGYRDRALSQSVEPETLFRIASLSKSFTRAAIHTLRRRGRLALDRPAFDILDLEPLPGESYNERLDGVTVGHLLSHRGGWDREQSYDPVFSQLDIALERGWETPPDERQLVRYMLSEPLQFEPGTSHGYSNLGYIVLGLVVDSLTAGYQEFLTGEVFDSIDPADVQVGRSLPADRPDRETHYFDGRICPNVVDLSPLELVRCPDGGYHHEPTAASGGHIVTVRAFLTVMKQYWLSGRRRVGDHDQRWQYDGTLPGTYSTALQHRGLDVVVVFNERGYDPNHDEVRRRLVETIERQDR